LNEIKVVEPSEYYHEDKHDNIKELHTTANSEKIEIEVKIKSIEELKS